MTTKCGLVRRSAADWQRLLEEWQRDGSSLSEFCANLPSSTAWQRVSRSSSPYEKDQFRSDDQPDREIPRKHEAAFFENLPPGLL